MTPLCQGWSWNLSCKVRCGKWSRNAFHSFSDVSTFFFQSHLTFHFSPPLRNHKFFKDIGQMFLIMSL